MENFDLKKVMKWLAVVLKCPVCSAKYDSNQTRILETKAHQALNQAHILIHSDCKKCKSSVMFNIEINGPEVFSVGMITDLTSTDSSRFKNKQPISPNEVIGIHQALQDFKGNILEQLTVKK